VAFDASLRSHANLIIQVIHNPGMIPDARLIDPSIDITVVFEGSYQDYQQDPSSKALRTQLASLPYDRSRLSCLMFSVPTGMSQGDRRNLANELSQHAEFLYLTDRNQNYYESLGSHWQDFIAATPT
jgi:Spherulation-specific family 4